MVTVHREAGLQFMIYKNDHEPAHVHVFGDGEMKVTIQGASGMPEIVYAARMKTGDRRRAMDIMLEQQATFAARWIAIQEAR